MPRRLNKYRDAIDLLQKGRNFIVESIADEILDQGDGLLEGSYQFNELLETQGTRLHFLTLLMGQLEQSAETLEESKPAPRRTLRQFSCSKEITSRSPRGCNRKCRPRARRRIFEFSGGCAERGGRSTVDGPGRGISPWRNAISSSGSLRLSSNGCHCPVDSSSTAALVIPLGC